MMSEVWKIARMNLMKCWIPGKIWLIVVLLATIMAPQINAIRLILIYLWMLFPQSYEEIDKTDQLTAMLPIKRARVVQGWMLYGGIGIAISGLAQLPMMLVGRKVSGMMWVWMMLASIFLLACSTFTNYAVGGAKGRVVFIIIYVLGCTSAPIAAGISSNVQAPPSFAGLLPWAAVIGAAVLGFGYWVTMLFYSKRQL